MNSLVLFDRFYLRIFFVLVCPLCIYLIIIIFGSFSIIDGYFCRNELLFLWIGQ